MANSSSRLETLASELNYAPSEELYWQQGRSTENDFLYVTTTRLRIHQGCLLGQRGSLT